MSDRPVEHDGWTEPDAAFISALRTMEPPPHGEGFWDRLDGRLAAEPLAAADEPPLAAVTLEPPVPPLTELVPLPAHRRSQRWWMAAAAAVLVVVAATALVGNTSTDVRTTPPAATTLPTETSGTTSPTSAPPASPGVVPAPTLTTSASGNTEPAVPRSPVPSSAPGPTTTTTSVDPLVLSPTGVGPLRMGMTVQQAVATGAITGFSDQSGNGTCGVAYGSGTYRRNDVGALFLDGRLARVYAEQDSRLRTPNRIGIGSPASALSTVPGTRVDQPNPYEAGATDVLVTNGNTGYLFTVADGTVRSWSAGTTAGLSVNEACS